MIRNIFPKWRYSGTFFMESTSFAWNSKMVKKCQKRTHQKRWFSSQYWIIKSFLLPQCYFLNESFSFILILTILILLLPRIFVCVCFYASSKVSSLLHLIFGWIRLSRFDISKKNSFSSTFNMIMFQKKEK